jgi:hypothetical protein
MTKKRCAQCGGKLPLGVRVKNHWTDQGRQHLRFCSKLCETNNELEYHTEVRKRTAWTNYLSRANP